MNNPQNHKNSKQASYSLIFLGLVLIALWLSAAKPWEDRSDIPLLFLLDEAFSYFLLIVLLFGVYILGLGLHRLLRASWDKNKKNN